MNVQPLEPAGSPRRAPPAERALSPRAAWAWSAALMLAALPAALGPGLVARLAALRELARGPNPYWIPERALELYVALPLAALSGALLVLAPGLLATLAFNRAVHGGRWLAEAFAVSLAGLSLAAALAQAVGLACTGRGFALLLLGLAGLAGGLAALRARRAGAAASARLAAPSRRTASDLAWALLPPFLLVPLLAPKFLWEDFNGDGAHAFEAARLLLVRPLPFWDPEHSDVAEFPGLTSFLFLYPLSWFVRLFGACEAAVRLAYLPILATFAGLAAAFAERGARRLSALERAGLWAGLFSATAALAFSATYSPHNADLALPATQDVLVAATFLGFALALIEGSWAWALAWLAATWLCAPNGPLLALIAVPAALSAGRPIDWRRAGAAALAVLACALLARGFALALELANSPPPGDEYAGASLASRFRFLIFSDARRFLFALVPAGIAPFASLFAWPRLDRAARFLWLAALGSFAVFYVQAGVALHHFVPAMLLPIAAFWRWRASAAPSRGWALAALAGAAVALVLARPRDASPRLAAQTVGRTISERSGDYAALGHAAFQRMDLLHELYPFSADPRVPEESYGGAAIVWNHYALHERPGDPIGARTNAILQGPLDPAPEGFELAAQSERGALWLRDRGLLREQLAIRQPTPAGSPLFALERTTLFRQADPASDPRVVDAKKLVQRLLGR